jgi:MFS family permease
LSTLAVGFGQWAQQLGLPLLTLELTGSATQLGALAFFRGIVGTVTAPIGGVLADRYPRRRVIIASTALSMVQASALAILIVAHLIQMWHVYVFAFLGGIIQSLTQPARQAYVYDVSTDATLQNAIAMNSFVQNLSRIAAPPLVGAMVIWGIGAPFIFMAATQVVAMGFTLLISRNTRQAAPSKTNPFRQIAEGFRFTWEDRRILGLVVVSAIPALLIFPYLPFIALVSRDVLHTGPTGYGLLTSMLGWGSIVGMFCLAMFRDPPHKGRLMLGGFLGYAGLLIVFSQSRSFVLDLAVLGIAGIFFSIAQALNNTLIQLATRNEIRGRIMAVWQMSAGLQPLGALPLGFLITHYGVQVGIGSFMVSATIAFLLFSLLWSSVRRM